MKIKLMLAIGALLLGFAVGRAQEYTVIALPDTQNYSSDYPDIYHSQTQFCVDQFLYGNTEFVTHLGDIVNEAETLWQWDNAKAAMNRLDIGEVPYLARAVECGYGPGRLSEVKLLGDITTLKALDRHAERIKPYDDEFYHWPDVDREFKNLKTPMRFYWGGSRARDGGRCLTGCVMGLKMFMGFHERFAGAEAFRKAKPVVFVIGNVGERIDAAGEEVFMLGSCARAEVVNAKRVLRINNCFTTAVEMTMAIRGRMGISSPFYDMGQLLPLALYFMAASGRKLVTGRYFQDIAHFFAHGLLKKI